MGNKRYLIFILFILSLSFASPLQKFYGSSYFDLDGNNVTTNMTNAGLYASKNFVLLAPSYSINMTINTTAFNNDANLNFTFKTNSIGLVGNISAEYFNQSSGVWSTICSENGIILPTSDTSYNCSLNENINSTGISYYRINASSTTTITGRFDFSDMFLFSSKNITECQNITQSGSYTLANDLIGAPITPIPFRTNACIMIYGDNVTLDGNGFSITNNATDDAVGIEINASNVEIKNIKNISAYAFGIFGVTGVNNSIHNSSIIFNQIGSAFYQMNNTNIYNNSIIDIVDEGIVIGYSHNISIYNNNFFNISTAINATSLGNTTNIYNNNFNYIGFSIDIHSAFHNISNNNIINTTYGINIEVDSQFNSTNNYIYNNNISIIEEVGIQLIYAQNSTIYNNHIYDGYAGFYSQYDLTGPYFSNNQLNNLTFATFIESNNNTIFNKNHLFNNTYSLVLSSMSSDFYLQFNGSNNIFDNPEGNYQNYTNITINDLIEPQSKYYLNWFYQPASLYPGDISFNNKYLNFSSDNESHTIDESIWYWTSSEELGYTPSNLRLKFYNGSWQNLSSLPNTMTRTLTLNNMNTSGVYGILQINSSNLSNCPVINSPGEYNLTSDSSGAPNDVGSVLGGYMGCIYLNTSNIELNCNNHNIINDGTVPSIGIVSYAQTNVTIKNCNIKGYTINIHFDNVDYSNISNNNINSTINGYSINTINSDNTNMSFNTIDLNFNTAYGILVYNENNNLIEYNIISSSIGNLRDAIALSGAVGSVIDNNIIFGTGNGITLSTVSTGYIISNNSISTNGGNGVYTTFFSTNSVTSNNILYNNYRGIYIQSSNGVYENNLIFNNSNDGVRCDSGPTNIQLNNQTIYNNGYGIYISGCSNVVINNSNSYSNQNANVYLDSSYPFSIYNTQLYNSSYGLYSTNIHSLYLSNIHFYNNLIDKFTSSDDGTQAIVNASYLVFDNPSGNYANYTNLSTYYNISMESLLMNWSHQSILPGSNVSFRNKWINISKVSGNPILNQLEWVWSATEAIGYNESNFTLYRYNGGWTYLGGLIDLTSHTLTITNIVVTNGSYGILDGNNPITVTFISPTPADGSTVTTTSIQLELLANQNLSNCIFEINGVNQSGTVIDGTNCEFGFTGMNGAYIIKGFGNFTGQILSTSTRTFTISTIPTPSSSDNTLVKIILAVCIFLTVIFLIFFAKADNVFSLLALIIIVILLISFLGS